VCSITTTLSVARITQHASAQLSLVVDFFPVIVSDLLPPVDLAGHGGPRLRLLGTRIVTRLSEQSGVSRSPQGRPH